MFSLKQKFLSELSTWFSDKLAFRNFRLVLVEKPVKITVNWIKSIFSRTYELVISFRVTVLEVIFIHNRGLNRWRTKGTNKILLRHYPSSIARTPWAFYKVKKPCMSSTYEREAKGSCLSKSSPFVCLSSVNPTLGASGPQVLVLKKQSYWWYTIIQWPPLRESTSYLFL